MGKIRDMFPGGNTCYGFYSLYEYIIPATNGKKIILKGGPGAGKSTFMKSIAKDFSQKGFDVEYHWCSSDNNSLDGIVIGKQEICIIDGTLPHIVDPRYPGAFDQIINLGQFWDEEKIRSNREPIIKTTHDISRFFKRAYHRLQETKLAYEEWQMYNEEAIDNNSVNRNILELTNELLANSTPSSNPHRHLFAAAITPEGIINKVNSLIDKDYKLFAVKGYPGVGISKLFSYALQMANLKGIYAEVFHNPFDPEEIDLIIFPDGKNVLINISDYIVDYVQQLPTGKYKRFLDFNQFLDKQIVDSNARYINRAINRFAEGLQDSVNFIKRAKKYHDKLESYYVPAMDFEQINIFRNKLFEEIISHAEKLK